MSCRAQLFLCWTAYNNCRSMIENIIILLVANTVIPYLPFSPTYLLPAPLALIPLQSPSAFQNMNLTRLYKAEDFKRTFR